jgi:tetratricopeptide (TPR) repeat protein
MKRTLLFICITIFTLLSRAQAPIDSLRSVSISNGSYEDRIKAFLKIIAYYELRNFDSTLIEGEKALELARKNADSVSVAQIKKNIGVASYFKGKYDVAAKNYYEAVAILEKADDNKNLAPIYNELGKLYRKTRDLGRSLENYNKAAAIYTRLDDIERIGSGI